MKEKANNNRTLQLNKAERAYYASRLLKADDLSADFTDRTLCADLMEVIDRLPTAFADLIIVDPPYNLDKQFGQQKFRASSDSAYRAYLHSWMEKVCSKLKPDGSLYLCGDWHCSAALFDELSTHLTILNRITWQREKGRGSLHNWKNGMEDIWFAVKDPHHYCFQVDAVKQRRKVNAPYRVDGQPKDWEETPDGNFRDTYPSNFWDDISIPYWSMPENTDHPTQKPEKLIAKLILASSEEGDMVFDPFLGSGTTSVVARKLGRHYLGIEREQEYACLAEKRLEQAQTSPQIQGYADGVFWERNTYSQLRTTKKK